MDKKDLFTAGIFYTAFLAFLLTGISFIISPLKDDIKQNRTAIQQNATAIQNLNVKLDTNIQALNAKLDTNIQALNVKLDRLIFAVLKNNSGSRTKPRRKPSSYKNTQAKPNQ